MGIIIRLVSAIWLTTTVISHRLPNDIRPNTYDVKIKVYVEDPFTFEGSVNIDVRSETDGVQQIILHSNGLNITKLTINNEETKYVVSNTDDHFLTINLNSPINKGDTATIGIQFNGELSEDMYGFYRSSYLSETGETKWLAATQFQATHGRRVFPCFDEPAFKSKFSIELTIPNKYHALCNTPLEDGYPQPIEGEEWDIYKFKQSDLMSTYLVAFVVSDFTQMIDSEAKYRFSAWARKDAIEKAAYSQKIGPLMVDWFEEYTGIPYTFEKIDQVALPDFAAGAMENWGLITYRETGLLFYDEATTEANKKSLALVVGHELAHMWFGNLVTLDWWSDTWLNEGFARYFQYFVTSKIETDWRLMDQFLVDQQHSIFVTDSLASAQALSSECNTPAEVSAKFTSISYSKGGSILRMVSHILTPSTFQEALKQYLEDHRDSNTIPEDLFKALENSRNIDKTVAPSVTQFLSLWTTQPGYPVINVQRNGNSFTVSQERFLLKADENTEHEHWWVPLSWTKESDAPAGFNNTQPTGWLEGEASKVIEIDSETSEWVMFNNEEAGYYRVNYDEETWKLIINTLYSNPSKIHILNRAQLVDDALNLARAGKLKYEIALDVVDYLREEDDYIPWASAFSALSFLNRKLLSEDDFGYFQTYIHQITAKIYDSIGFEIRNDDGHITHLHRSSLLSWACTFDNEHCVEQAMTKFSDYKNDVTNLVPANLRSVVYCTALRKGSEEEWNFLWSIYVDSRIAAEKVIILSALGCTENEGLLRNFLEKSVTEDSGIRRQDAASAFAAVYANSKGLDVAFEFLENSYEQISVYYGGMNAISNILTGIAGRLTTEEHVQRLEQFIENNSDNLGSAAEAGRNAIESARADMEWTNLYKGEILSWFKNKVDSSTESSTEEPTTDPAGTGDSATTQPPTQPSTEPTTPDSANVLTQNGIICFILVLICSFFMEMLIN